MKLYVKVLSDKLTVCVRAGELRSVDSVKNQVMEKLKLPTGNDEHLYRAQSSATGDLEMMEHDKTLQHYGIKPGAILYLGMTISVSLTMVSGEGDVAVDIHTSDSVEDVKKAIQRRVGLTPVQQRLILRGRIVKDDGKVRDYDIKNNDKLFVIRRVSCYNIIIRNCQSNQHIATLAVDSSLTTKVVKEMISVHCQQLYFQESLLNDSKTLGYYGIGHGCALTLSVCGQIFVRNLAGKTVALDIGAMETVESVKSKITSREGIPQRLQTLMFNGRQLQEGMLKEYGVQTNVTLNLCLCLRGGGAMEVCIQTTDGIIIFVQVEKDTTVLKLKEKIRDQKGFPVDHQKLIFAGKVMEDRLTMADYNIQMATTLHLVVSQPGRKTKQTQVTVITDTGRELSCHVARDDCIEKLMSTIEDMEGIPTNCQQLFCKGQVLDYRKSLNDYKFDDTKYVVYLDFKGKIRVFVNILSSIGKYSAVKSLDKKMSLSVSEEMKVSGLKRIIERRENIPTYFQTLVYNGYTMEDDQSLGLYSVCHNSILHLWPETLHPMELTVTVKTPSQARQLPKLQSSTKIVNLKQSSRSLMDRPRDIPVEQYRLFYGPVLLENDKSLQDYMVTNGSELYLVPPEEFPILVNTTLGSTVTKCLVQVKKTDEIKVIKNRIYGTTDVPHECLDLYLSSMLLEDEKTVDSYRISAACSLTAVCSGEIPVSIKTRFATIPLAIDPSKSVESVVERISRSPELGMPLHRQRLLLHHNLLSSEKIRHKTSKELQISAGNTLNLVVTPEEMELYICTPRGSTLTLVLPNEYTIHDVKEAIEQSEGIPVENQILPFRDDKTIGECSIEPGTHLDIGYLSVVPVKATTEQQEKCERVIMQQHMKQELQQHMKQEMESNQCMFEMQLDSASNYMQTKISNFEGELAQSQQQIADLQRKNRELTQKLAKEKKKMKLIEDKLMAQTKVSRSVSVPEVSKEQHSIITCVSEEEEVDLDDPSQQLPATDSVTSFRQPDSNLIGEFSYSGREYTFSSKEHGLKLHFPEQELKVSVMSLNISSEDFKLHDNAELVSAVYQITASSALPCPVAVEMEHCVDLRDAENAGTLCFVRASSEGGPPYRFEVIQGGQFTPNERYGKIQVSQFSEYAIVRFFKYLCGIPAPLFCCYNAFEKQIAPNTHYIYITVTKNLASYIEHLKDSEYKDYDHIADQEIALDDIVGVDIEQAMQCVKYWKLTAMKTPATISRDAVERYSSGKCVPHIWLRVRCDPEQESPRREDLTVTLTGICAPNPVSFVIECVPGITNTQRGSFESDNTSLCSSITSATSRLSLTPDKPIFSKPVDIRKFSLIRFRDHEGEKELRIEKQIEPYWRDVAKHLGFAPARIEAFASSPNPTDKMIMEWMQTDTESCWGKLIERMNDADLKTPANDLMYALSKCPCDKQNSQD